MNATDLLRELDHSIPHADHSLTVLLGRCQNTIRELLYLNQDLEQKAYTQDADGNVVAYMDMASAKTAAIQEAEINDLYEKVAELEDIEKAWIGSLREGIHLAGGVTAECRVPADYIKRLKDTIENLHAVVKASQDETIEHMTMLDKVRSTLLDESVALPADSWLVDWVREGAHTGGEA